MSRVSRWFDGGWSASHGRASRRDAEGAPRDGRYHVAAMSTRKLILAALLCGMAIIVAFTLQIVLLGH